MISAEEMGVGMRPLKVGLHLPETERIAPWCDLAAMCRLAEEVGFDSIWVPDHLVYHAPGQEPKGPWECWSILSAVAAVTHRVEIGPLVLCTNFRNPALIAKMADTVDEISGGRLILGLGAGWHEPEYRAFGFPYEPRVGRFFEAFTIIRTLLRDGAIDFQGKHYTVRDCELRPRGPRPAGPPLLIGSRGDQILRKTAPYVDYWNAWAVWNGNRPEGMAPLHAQVDAACAATGRDPAEIARTVAVFVQLPGGTEPDNPRAPWLRGSSEALAETLRAFARAGVAHAQILLDPNTAEGIAAFAPVLALLDGGGGLGVGGKQ
jgi:alkanesulfonate monooxygenase SsuD/methylene tetrahydromethanopterin reductase-like flavin-dependent oxidoreductase (luciferase family)